MTTRPEFCTSEPAIRKDDSAGKPAGDAVPISRRWLLDITLCLVTMAYVFFALFDGMDSPLFGLMLIILVGHELIQPHLGRR